MENTSLLSLTIPQPLWPEEQTKAPANHVSALTELLAKMVGPPPSAKGVAHLQASERRTCSIVNADRTMVHYRSRRPPDTELRAQLPELAKRARKRFGYRRLFVLLCQQGEPSGISYIYWFGRKASRCASVVHGLIRRSKLTPRIASPANVTLMVPLRLTMRCRLIGRARWLSRLARREGLWAGRALHSPSRPQTRAMG
jgi:hypothetical protein